MKLRETQSSKVSFGLALSAAKQSAALSVCCRQLAVVLQKCKINYAFYWSGVAGRSFVRLRSWQAHGSFVFPGRISGKFMQLVVTDAEMMYYAPKEGVVAFHCSWFLDGATFRKDDELCPIRGKGSCPLWRTAFLRTSKEVIPRKNKEICLSSCSWASEAKV